MTNSKNRQLIRRIEQKIFVALLTQLHFSEFADYSENVTII